MRRLTSALLLVGLLLLLAGLARTLEFGAAPMEMGQAIVDVEPDQVGAANIVTAVVLDYRGMDTLGELAILFTAAAAAGLVLGQRRPSAPRDPQGGFILRTGVDLLFPLLLVVGIVIIADGHRTPGGGFQGGVILACAFFLPVLVRPSQTLNHRAIALLEGLAGATFIVIGLAALVGGGEFLEPMLGPGTLGDLFSAGTLPLLYAAVGVKVGAELAGLLTSLADFEASD